MMRWPCSSAHPSATQDARGSYSASPHGEIKNRLRKHNPDICSYYSYYLLKSEDYPIQKKRVKVEGVGKREKHSHYLTFFTQLLLASLQSTPPPSLFVILIYLTLPYLLGFSLACQIA